MDIIHLYTVRVFVQVKNFNVKVEKGYLKNYRVTVKVGKEGE